MEDNYLKNQRLIAELAAMRKRVKELEAAIGGAGGEGQTTGHAEEAKFKEIGASIPGAVFQFRITPEGRRTFPFVSEGIRELTGLSPSQMAEDAAELFTRVLPEDSGTVELVIAESFATMETRTVEFRVKTPQGDIRWLRSTSSPHREPDGSVVWNGIIADITEQKRAVEELRAAEVRYRTVFDSVGDSILVLGAEGRFIEANQAACEQLGYTREQVVTMRPQDLAAPAFIPFIPDVLKDMDDRGNTIFETAHVTAGGKVIPLEGSGKVVDFDGKKAYIVVFRDVTARKKADEELLRLRKAVDTSGEVVFLTDRDGLIRYVNPEFTRVYGYDASEVVDRVTPRIIKSGAMPPEAYQAFWQTLLDRQVIRGELVNKTRDGRLVDIEGSASPVVDDRGEIIGFLALQRDISVRKKAEKELLSSQERLERIHRLSKALSSSLDLEKVTGLALDELVRTFSRFRTTAGVVLLDDWGQQLTVVAARGTDEKTATGGTFPLSSFSQEVVKRVFKQHKPWTYHDVNDAPDVLKMRPGFLEQKSLILLPLLVGDSAIGYIFLGSGDPSPLSSGEIVLLETYASEMALAVQNARLYARTDAALRRRIADLEALTAVLGAATTSLDLDATMKDVLKRSAQALATERVALFLAESDRSANSVRFCYSADGKGLGSGVDLDLADFPALRETMTSLAPVSIQDIPGLPEGGAREKLVQSGARSALLVPLAIGGKAIGTLYFASSQGPRRFAPEEISLASAIGSYLASVVENSRLHENVSRERGTLESIIASMNEGVIVVDSTSRVVYCNRAAQELLGFDAAECVGHTLENLIHLLSSRIDGRQDWMTNMKEGIERGSTGTFNVFIRLALRREIEGRPFVVGREGRRLGMGVLLRDVTQEREVDRMKTEFISIASHELRTPMTSVYGFAELLLLRAKDLPREQRQWVETIHRESKRLSVIVEDLLNVSRIEAGRLSLNVAPTQVLPVAEQIVQQLQLGYTSHHIRIDIDERSSQVLADVDKLQQVLYNLIDNALKYSPVGGEVLISSKQGNDGSIVFFVQDHGLGIPPEEVPKLFTRFHRVERPETTGLRGTGLGLYIARSLVEMMGGRIWVESELNKGSTFYVSLPAAMETTAA